MNFLAHLRLAGSRDEALLGGMLGDFVKGTPEGRFSAGVADGIRLHRAIDSFADGHAVTRASRGRISPARRRFAGVIVDVCYDHFLCRHWPRFYPEDLDTFARRVYGVLSANRPLLPERLTRVLPRMIAENWLAGYVHLERVGDALDRMTRRLTRGGAFLRSVEEIEASYAALEADFLAFFPDLVAFCAGWSGGPRPRAPVAADAGR